MKAKPAAFAARSRSAADPQQFAESQLRGASVRVTDARVNVLTTLLGARSALSHQDVQDSLPSMDRVTLYRALDCLIEAGLAHRIAGDDRVFRYSADAMSQRDENTHHQHGHFQCTRCAKVFCLDSIGEAELLHKTLQETLGKGFQSHDIEFTIKGWCAECAH